MPALVSWVSDQPNKPGANTAEGLLLLRPRFTKSPLRGSSPFIRLIRDGLSSVTGGAC
jgi:hypothetical protein